MLVKTGAELAAKLCRGVVTLPVELTCAGQRMPSFEVFGNDLVRQRAFAVAHFSAVSGLVNNA
jgi:hypothetical protein